MGFGEIARRREARRGEAAALRQPKLKTEAGAKIEKVADWGETNAFSTPYRRKTMGDGRSW
jgi:hypothetical protein